MRYVRYLVKCSLNSGKETRDRLASDIKSGSLARGKIFYEGMQAALRDATIDENNEVHFIETCYCLEGGLSPMAMEIPVLSQYFASVSGVKDARFRDQCTMMIIRTLPTTIMVISSLYLLVLPFLVFLQSSMMVLITLE